jgi:hypothetical protein
MTRVAKFEKADETTPICIIGLKPSYASPLENIERLDFGVCMAAFDGKETIKTPEFVQDIEARTFTLRSADNKEQFAYSMARFRKIAAGRYAGWEMAVPSKFEDLLREHDFDRRWYRDETVKGMEAEMTLRPKERAVV